MEKMQQNTTVKNIVNERESSTEGRHIFNIQRAEGVGERREGAIRRIDW